MKDQKLCTTPFCKRNRRKHKKYCNTCDKKIWRQNNPIKACFQTLRHNCTRRGIFFDLTFEQFNKFCYETNYMSGKGRSKESYSIDRVIDGKKPGYTFSNIQMLTKSQNSSKEQKRRKKNKTLVYDWKHPEYAKVI